MQQTNYDFTCTDLNPKFLFSSIEPRIQEVSYHQHDFIELVIILDGKGCFYAEDTEYAIQAGDVIILNPGTRHKSLPSGDAKHAALECYLAFTDVEYIGCLKNTMPLFPGRSLIASLPLEPQKELFRLCRAIEQENRSCNTGRYFMLKAYLIQVLCLLERFQKLERESARDRHAHTQYEFKSINKKYVVSQITKYMEEHYREKISLGQIAANIYLSSFYISKIFKSETGDTPINYLISLRMNKARQLLDENPECSIQSVASAVGYEDTYHFSKLFKKYYGLSPLHYKARKEL